MYSQNTSITPTKSQKARIEKLSTPERLIEYSKGLSNEKNLKLYVLVQDSIIRAKDSLIIALQNREAEHIKADKVFVEKQRTYLSVIENLNLKLTEANSKIRELSEFRLGVEESKKHTGLYATGRLGNGFTYRSFNGVTSEDKTYKDFFLGFSYISTNLLLGLELNPLNETTYYAVKVGLKVW